MAIRRVYIGTVGPFLYDDADTYPDGTSQQAIYDPDGPADLINHTQAFPVGSVFIAVVSTNPASLLGYGTWSAFGAGRLLVGIDPGDVDFDTVEKTGGSKTHKHTIDPPNTIVGTPSTTTAVTATGVSVASATHTHDVDIAAFDSETADHMPPYIVVYMWKRTA